MRRVLPIAGLLLTSACAIPGPPQSICDNASGVRGGRFFTFWHDTGSGCMTLHPQGGFDVAWDLSDGGNLVAGVGWPSGSTTRTIVYHAETFEPGSNGYLGLYGWSTEPLVEYYVVDDWGDFTPPGPGATMLGTVESDGGNYRIYRTRRVRQPSIAGVATFDQYWSVRTERRAIGSEAVITFANHVAAWRNAGLDLGRLNYQVVAAEGFGSTGKSDIEVHERRSGEPLAP